MPSEARKKDARRAVDQLLWVAKYPQLMVRIFMDFSADFGSPNSAESLAGESMAASDWLQPKSLGQDRQPWGPAARQHTSCTFYWLARQNGFRAPKDREKLDKSRLCRYGWRGSARRTSSKGVKKLTFWSYINSKQSFDAPCRLVTDTLSRAHSSSQLSAAVSRF